MKVEGRAGRAALMYNAGAEAFMERLITLGPALYSYFLIYHLRRLSAVANEASGEKTNYKESNP